MDRSRKSVLIELVLDMHLMKQEPGKNRNRYSVYWTEFECFYIACF